MLSVGLVGLVEVKSESPFDFQVLISDILSEGERKG